MTQLWAQQREVIVAASKCREPDQAGLQQLFSGVAASMRDIQRAIQRNAMENNLKTISEGVQSLNWLLVKPAPVDFMTSYIDGSEMWSNRIRKEFKGVNDDQILFCTLFKRALVELRAYVKEFHTTGLAWNPKGASLGAIASDTRPASTSGSLGSSTVTAGAAPVTTTADPAAAGKGGLFAALSQGEGVTSGLKKVTKDQQTWRAEYKGTDAVPAPKTALKAVVDKGSVASGPATMVLRGDKWQLDYQTASQSPVIVRVSDIKQTVYLYKCDGAAVTVEGKCKSIVIDSCRKVALNFADVVAGVEVVNSKSTKVSCSSKVPSFAIDKSDGVHLTLPASSLDVEVVASKSSEMNLSFPDPSNPSEMLERPIPEQYVHTIEGKNVTARVSDLYSH